MPIQIQYRRGVASLWTSVNPTLALGEPGYETDTGKFKVGDGSLAWNSLPYSSGPPGIEVDATPPVVTTILWADTGDPGDMVIPAGGAEGQVLAKTSATNYATDWTHQNPRAVPVASGGTKYFGVPGGTLLSTSTLNLSGTRPNGWYSPFFVDASIEINELQYEVTNTPAAAVTIVVTIWDADADWQPIAGTARVLASTSITGPGVTTVTGLTTTLTRNRYLTEVHQAAGAGSITPRIFGVTAGNAPSNDLTASPQNPGRYWFNTNASSGTDWSGALGVGGGAVGVQHYVLYKWSLV